VRRRAAAITDPVFLRTITNSTMPQQPQSGLFITGTDTGVGKTRVGVALARALVARGRTVRARKPVESGCNDGPDGLHPIDGDALRIAAGEAESLHSVCRYRLRAAISPERAARLEGAMLDMAAVREACVDGVEAGDWLQVEGAGGFCSPLVEGALNADLAVALGLPVLLVAADRLGVINHTLLSVEAIARRGLVLAGVVLNRVTPDTDAAMDNADDLARWLRCPLWRFAHGDDPAAESAALQPWLDALAGADHR
jgi:dethiobiotin synthetase